MLDMALSSSITARFSTKRCGFCRTNLDAALSVNRQTSTDRQIATVTRDREAKRKMTDTGLEKHAPNKEEDLPEVLLHGTSGQSEDWSQVVEQLTSHRPVIRLNYAEPVTGTDSANAPRVSDFADRVVAAAGAGGWHRFDLVGFSLGAAGARTILVEEYVPVCLSGLCLRFHLGRVAAPNV